MWDRPCLRIVDPRDGPIVNVAISVAIVFFSMVLIVLTKVVEKRYGGRE